MREDIIRNKMTRIIEIMDSIDEYIPEDEKSFMDLGIIRDGIYKRLEYAIENVFDICSILNSDLKLGIPEDESNIVGNLVNEGILSKGWTSKLREMKAFRNILVHRYGSIDDKISFRILKDHISDFSGFVHEIDVYLEGFKKNKGRKDLDQG